MGFLSIPLSMQAYIRLKGLILDGQVGPGDALSERHLADRLELGRMPVREALRELVKDGLVESLPGRGTFVRRLSVEDLQDIYEARQAVEGMTAFLAAKRGATPALKAFRTRFRELVERPDADLREVQRAGQAFHIAVAGAARNGELARILDGLQARIALTLTMAAERCPSRILVSLREHMGILDAIEAGDATEARSRMWTHLATGFAARVRLYSAVA